MNGLHYPETVAGMVFTQTTTTLGLAIPIYTATAIGGAGVNSMPLWNPPSSNRMVELISIDINRASGTADFGAIVMMGVPLQAIATAAPVTALATTQPISGRLGLSADSRVSSNNGAGTCTATAGTAGAPTATAPGVVRSIGSINLEADTGTAHPTAGFTYVFNGTVAVPLGYMIYFACTKASVALYCCTLTWKETIINRDLG